jgi:galactose mutarotase-like enzyme
MFRVTRGETLELSDDGARSAVSIVPERGAIVTRFRARERELLYLDDATLGDRTKNVRGGIPILFPSPGKLEGDHWKRGVREGAMKQHGFARDLPWVVGDASTEDAARVTLTLASSERTHAMYPWEFVLSVTYSLRGERLRLDVRVANKDKDPMPFGFGLHPYFFVTDKGHAHIATRATRAYDNVTKETVPFRGFDLTLPEVDLHLLDHGSADTKLTYPNDGIGQDQNDGQIGPGSGQEQTKSLAIRASPEFTRWVVWTLAGKNFVCVEPWSAPGNALNTGESLTVVAPGATHAMFVEFEAA